MACPKAMGGLGFKDFRAHLDTLLSKWVLKALDNPGSKWAQLFAVNLRMAKWRNYKSIRRNKYSTANLLLLGMPVSFLQLTYTGTLWKAWSLLRDYLILHPTDLALPGHWTIADLLRVLQAIHLASTASLTELAAILGRIGCRQVSDLWDTETQTWKDLQEKMDRVRGLIQSRQALILCFLCTSTLLHSPFHKCLTGFAA
jgi:hypothetical protein